MMKKKRRLYRLTVDILLDQQLDEEELDRLLKSIEARAIIINIGHIELEIPSKIYKSHLEEMMEAFNPRKGGQNE